MKRIIQTLAVSSLVLSSARALAEDTILVLDASGSMWGQIDGKTKVEIARQVVGGLLDDIPADRRLGLVAYGHRREADCADIEEIVPVGTDRAAIRTAVNGLSFKGRTPFGAAVKFAAERLRSSEQKATVVLVSDGVETCNVDPCALGRELEAAGVDFTAHVIGFGLASETEAAGLQCLAAATGGRYFGARNAGDLTAALTATVSAPPPPETPARAGTTVIELRATELDGGPEISAGLTWTIKSAAGATAFERADAGLVETEIAPGQYDVRVVRESDGLAGAAKLDARAGAQRTVTIPLVFPLEATVDVTPDAAPVGSQVSVQWTGPNRNGDYITIVKSGATPGDYLDYKYTNAGTPVSIAVPTEPGDYEMRYVLEQPQRVLAAVPLKATAVVASVTAPATGVEGSPIEISWTGPQYANDWLTVVKPAATATDYNDYVYAARDDHVVELPLGPGDYEVRYVQDGTKVLARVPIRVTAATAAITAPASVAAGASFEISWTGPNNHSDWLTVVEPNEGAQAYASYVDAERGSPATLNAAAKPGAYELRYVLKGNKVIAQRAIQVTPQ